MYPSENCIHAQETCITIFKVLFLVAKNANNSNVLATIKQEINLYIYKRMTSIK